MSASEPEQAQLVHGERRMLITIAAKQRQARSANRDILCICVELFFCRKNEKRTEKYIDTIKYLTVEEQQKFLEAAKRSHHYRQYVLLLETGLRTGELNGLTKTLKIKEI
jgi:integrase